VDNSGKQKKETKPFTEEDKRRLQRGAAVNPHPVRSSLRGRSRAWLTSEKPRARKMKISSLPCAVLGNICASIREGFHFFCCHKLFERQITR
jgi:hypothetical protein